MTYNFEYRALFITLSIYELKNWVLQYFDQRRKKQNPHTSPPPWDTQQKPSLIFKDEKLNSNNHLLSNLPQGSYNKIRNVQ